MKSMNIVHSEKHIMDFLQCNLEVELFPEIHIVDSYVKIVNISLLKKNLNRHNNKVVFNKKF